MEETLKQLFDEDQSDRENNPNPTPEEFQKVIEKDTLRRKRVQEIINEGLLTQPEDYYHAAFIFQHGKTTEDFLKANEFAKKALDLGFEKAKWIYAASMDRYLINIGKLQKYGTQYIGNGMGESILSPIDSDTTDEERALYGIEPLSKIAKKWSDKK